MKKVLAWNGEAEHSSCTFTENMAPSRSGGQCSHSVAWGCTKVQLYEKAQHENIANRSKMHKSELQKTFKHEAGKNLQSGAKSKQGLSLAVCLG